MQFLDDAFLKIDNCSNNKNDLQNHYRGILLARYVLLLNKD